MKHARILSASLALALLTMAGCSGGSSSNTPSTDFSGVTTEAATATSSEATGMATSITDVQLSTDAGTSADVAHSDALGIPGCPTVDIKSRGPEGNWTDKLLTYTNPPCSISGRRGYDTLAITGALELTRSDETGLSFTSTATNLEWAFTTKNKTYSETRNGTRSLTATASSATLANSISIAYVGGKYDGTLQHSLAATFTPDAGSSLAKGEPLPSGAFNISGSATWTGSDEKDGSFNVTTLQPLKYDATCKNTQPSVFDSGELQVQLASTAKSGSATITWSNCGAPTVVYTAAQ